MILIIGDPEDNRPTYYHEARATAEYLKVQGYNVKELYKKKATSKNILKGMYDADGIIYVGQGGGGTYDLITGIATGPYGLTGADKPILGYGNKMREGKSGPLFNPPFKKSGIPVIIAHACYSTGQTKGKNSYDIITVNNRLETIFKYSQMFTAWNANYLATLEPIVMDTPLVKYFVENNKPIGSMLNYWPNKNIAYDEQYNLKNNIKIWDNSGKPDFYSVLAIPLTSTKLSQINNNGKYTTFKDPNAPSCYGRFPKASETTPYDDTAAEDWYNSHNKC